MFVAVGPVNHSGQRVLYTDLNLNGLLVTRQIDNTSGGVGRGRGGVRQEGNITNDLKWNTHISNVCTKANRTLGFLRRNLYSCPPDVKEAAYKGLVRPVLEYEARFGTPTGSHSWPPGRTGKGPKLCGKVFDWKLYWEHDWHFRSTEMGIS